jgi:uncharacterized OsmC-like protein
MELKTTVQLLNEKLHFEGNVDGNEPVSIDYTPPLGDNLGYTSLELFLLSLSSCTGSANLVLLRKMKKSLEIFEVNSTGYRNEEHPTGFHQANRTDVPCAQPSLKLRLAKPAPHSIHIT